MSAFSDCEKSEIGRLAITIAENSAIELLRIIRKASPTLVIVIEAVHARDHLLPYVYQELLRSKMNDPLCLHTEYKKYEAEYYRMERIIADCKLTAL